jgi:hypothetical protein
VRREEGRKEGRRREEDGWSCLYLLCSEMS